jgi:hypothetical protein
VLSGDPAGSLRLRLRNTERSGQVLQIASPKCTVGSSPFCKLRLKARGVAPLHCLILRGAAGMIVRRWSADTRLNGAAFSDAPLRAGDRLGIGPIEFEVLPESDGAPPVPCRASPARGRTSPLAAAAAASPADTGQLLRIERLARRLTESRSRQRRRARRILGRLRRSRKDVESLRSQVETTRRDLDEAEARLAALSDKPADARRPEAPAPESLPQNRQELEQALEDERRRTTRLEEEWVAQRDSLSTRVAELSDACRRQGADLAEAQRRACQEERAAEEERARLTAEICELRQSLADARAKAREQAGAGGDEPASDGEAARISEREEALSRRLAEIYAREQAIEERERGWEAEREASQAELRERSERIERDSARIVEELRSLQRQQEQWAETRRGAEQQLRDDADLQTRRRDEVETEFAERRRHLEHEAARLEADRHNLQHQRDQWEHHRQRLDEELAERNDQYARQWEHHGLELAQRAQQLEDEADRLAAEKTALEAERRDWEAQRGEREAESGTSAASGDLATREAELARREAELEEQSSALARERGRLEEESRALAEERAGFADELKSAEEDIAARAEELDRRENELNELRERLAGEMTRPSVEKDESDEDVSSAAEEAATEENADPVAPKGAVPASTSEILARMGFTGFPQDDKADEPAPAGGIPSEAESPRIAGKEGKGAFAAPAGAAKGPSAPSGDDEESIESYMSRLMSRVRGEAAEPHPVSVARQQAMAVQQEADEAAADDEGEKESAHTDKPALEPSEYVPRGPAPERSVNLESMRELANTSARSAITSHARRRGSKTVTAKFVVAVIGLVAGLVLWFVSEPDSAFRYGAYAGFVVAAFWAMQAVLAASGKTDRAKRPADAAAGSPPPRPLEGEK